MFKRLRTKIVFMYLISISLVVFAFCAGIMLFSLNAANRMSDSVIERELARVVERHPNRPVRPFDRERGNVFTAALSVETNKEFAILDMYSPFFDVDEEFYEDIVEIVKNKAKNEGKFKFLDKYFKYKMIETDTSYVIAVAEVTREYNMLKNTFYHFVLLFVPLIIFLYLLCNYMVKKTTNPVEEAFTKQKTFIADASHELKTPLSVIRTNVDVLYDTAGGEQLKWLDYIKLEAGKMTELVNKLLYLAKVDKVEEKTQFMPFDLSKLAEDTIMPLEAVFFENNIELESHIQPDIILKGNKEHIGGLIGIFMDNAIKYSNGKIVFKLYTVQNSVKMEFFNTGTGIEPEEKEKIFDRFYRTDKSRELNGSFGLGLSIAKAVVQNHKGKITVDSEYGKWIKFTVSFKIK